MSTPVYSELPYAFHSGNAEDATAMQACLTMASLFTDEPLPAKAVPFMKHLGDPLYIEGSTYRVNGVRLEISKGTVGYSLLLYALPRPDSTIYRMALPHYPLLTRLHSDGELPCRLAASSGSTAALVYLLDLMDTVHPNRGRRMSAICRQLGDHLHKLAKKGFKDSIALTIYRQSIVLSKGDDLAMEETLFAAPILTGTGMA